MRGKVSLRPDQDAIASERSCHLGRRVGQRAAALEQEVGARRLAVAQILGADADRIDGLLEPRGINQLDGKAVAIAALRDVVAGGAGLRRDNRAIAPQKSVEEPALAGVRRPDQNDTGAVDAPLAVGELSANSAEVLRKFVELAGQARSGERVNIGLLGEIKIGLEVGNQIEQTVP